VALIKNSYMAANKEKINEVESLDDIKYCDYTEVFEVHEALQKANESISKLGLVPVSLLNQVFLV